MFGLMQRLKSIGCSVALSGLPLAELVSALHRLGASQFFNDEEVVDIYDKIALINGSWIVNKESKESAKVANALKGIAKSLNVASAALSGHETGLHSIMEFHATSLVAQNLALTSATDDDPHLTLASFRRDAGRIAAAALAAHQELSRKSDQIGRDALTWYDQFTQLLLDIAKKAKIDPTLGNDSVNDVPCGWLFEAASEFEAFLHDSMRSATPLARGKRLNRSRERLTPQQGQNPLRAS